jgi:hypothetical protein
MRRSTTATLSERGYNFKRFSLTTEGGIFADLVSRLSATIDCRSRRAKLMAAAHRALA